MTKDWMIDVLADLRQVALQNALPDLAESLDDAMIIAAFELREGGGVVKSSEGHDAKNFEFSGTCASGGASFSAPDAC